MFYVYWKIFKLEEQIGLKEKYLTVLSEEINEATLDLQAYRSLINMEFELSSDSKILNNLSFNDILETVILNEDSSESQFKILQQYYYNNVRNFKKEHDFYIEVDKTVKELLLSEDGVPESLIRFSDFLNNVIHIDNKEVMKQ